MSLKNRLFGTKVDNLTLQNGLFGRDSDLAQTLHLIRRKRSRREPAKQMTTTPTAPAQRELFNQGSGNRPAI